MARRLRLVPCAAALSASLLAGSASAQDRPLPPGARTAHGAWVWTFEDDRAGTLPAGFTEEEGEWRVVRQSAAPSGRRVLLQGAQNAPQAQNLALLALAERRDVDLSVRLQAASGAVARGGGLVWRAQDPDNYYLARYDPLHEDVRLFVVVDGARRLLARAEARSDVVSRWGTLRVSATGPRVRVSLDGRRLIDVRDETFLERGRVGLWTEGHARTAFDDLTLQAPPSRPLPVPSAVHDGPGRGARAGEAPAGEAPASEAPADEAPASEVPGAPSTDAVAPRGR